jgi:hypothetical protein
MSNFSFDEYLLIINKYVKNNENRELLENIKNRINLPMGHYRKIVMNEEQKKKIINIIDNYIYLKRNNNLIILIGKYEFELVMYYPNQEERRGLIKINSYIYNSLPSRELTHVTPTIDQNNEVFSTNYDIKTFYLYSSFSECGFWRLCIHKHNFEYGAISITLDKGKNDYVQETFINFKLQNFINNNIDKILINNELEKIKCELSFLEIEKNGININSRIKKIEPFYKYSQEFKCGARNLEGNRLIKLEELSEKISEKFPILSEPELIYENFNKELPIETLNKYYKMDELEKKGLLPKTPLLLNTTITTNIKGNIYKVILQSSNRNIPNVILYYINYDMSIVNPNKALVNVRNEYAPLLLLLNDNDSEINSYGLYSNYVVAGNYICKILEYSTQCRNVSNKKKCTKEYFHIGNIYNNLYPYNVIKKKKEFLFILENSKKFIEAVSGRLINGKSAKNKNSIITKLKLIISTKSYENKIENTARTYLYQLWNPLLDWIPLEEINWYYLSNNLSPKIIELLRYKINEEKNMNKKNYNNLNMYNKIDWSILSKNPVAIELLKENKDKIDWYNLSINPSAIELLKENKDKINYMQLSENLSAIELLEEKIREERQLSKKNYNKLNIDNKIDWGYLSSNSSAIELLKKNQDKIIWYNLSGNPSAIELLKKNQDKINWNILSSNSSAIELLKENQDKINWQELSSNPSAIELLKKKINEERNLNKKIYNILTIDNKIDWNSLSNNPNAIDLLKENKDKINWSSLSNKPYAINLLKEKIEVETKLNNTNNTNYNNLDKKINWSYLSSNPLAIELLKDNQDKIDWNSLFKNSNIFK